MLKDIKAVIFDLDGTLVDSMWIWRDIDIEFLARFEIELPNDLQDSIEGMSFSETAAYFKKRFELPITIDDIKATWTEMAEEKYRTQVPLKEGVYEFLKWLKEKNIKTGIASSNSLDLVKMIIKRHGVEQYFDSVHTSCEVGKGKPAPDIYLYVANELEVEPKHCLVFEDIIQGILAGKNAGMRVCAVEDEFSKSIEKEKRELADDYIVNYSEIEME